MHSLADNLAPLSVVSARRLGKLTMLASPRFRCDVRPQPSGAASRSKLVTKFHNRFPIRLQDKKGTHLRYCQDLEP